MCQCFFLYIYMYNFLFFVHMPEIFVHTRVRSCTKKSRNCFQNLAEIVFWYETCENFPAARAKEDRKEQKTLILEIGTFFCTYDPENLKRIKKHCRPPSNAFGPKCTMQCFFKCKYT